MIDDIDIDDIDDIDDDDTDAELWENEEVGRLQVSCPRCGAPRGVPCRASKGPHASRVALVDAYEHYLRNGGEKK